MTFNRSMFFFVEEDKTENCSIILLNCQLASAMINVQLCNCNNMRVRLELCV